MDSQRNASHGGPTTVRVWEVDRLDTAVAGLHVEYVRTDGESRPCVVTFGSTKDATMSVGSVGFSAIATTEIPGDRIVFALINAVQPGAMWNEVEVRPGDIFAHAPGTTFVGVEPAGTAASILVVPTESAELFASDLGAADPVVDRTVSPLPYSPPVQRLAASMWRTFEQPQLLGDSLVLTGLIDDAVRVMTRSDTSNGNGSRRISSRKIVRDCLDHVESTGGLPPPMSALCRAAFASESRVRQAFIDVVGVPPTRYFQMQLLSKLRTALIAAQPGHTTVTDIAMSHGVTQLGRVAGRYRSLYGELPSQTLRHRT